ncbi:hypothetical protein [Nocardia carnea]|uniref:hypothetical protein n=1 Tax=Nocardia carnea TaxID=37328 RepID=UPI0024564B87|nr:hypothetical protein [Nocardia carnea]
MDHKVETRNTSEYSPHARPGKIERSGSEFRCGWKLWSVAVLSLLTFALLFQPWLAASGPHGEVRSDAFGRLDGSVPVLRNTGERLTENVVSISGSWGGLAAAAALLTVSGLCLYRKTRAGLLLAIGAAVANAVFVPAALLHLNGKAPALRAMTEDHDELRTALGDIVHTFFGGGSGAAATEQAATAALTNQGLICGFLAVVTAVIALGMRGPVRAAVDEARAHAELAELSAAREPADDRAVVVHETVPVPEPRLQLVVSAADHPLGRTEPDRTAEQVCYDEDGKQRILPRAVPRRSDTQLGYPRRERQTARRVRPRPVSRAVTTVQPAAGALRKGRAAQSAAGAQRHVAQR